MSAQSHYFLGTGMRTSVFLSTLAFFFTVAPRLLALSLIASVGRLLQVGWEASLPPAGSAFLELLVGGARVAVFLLAVGNGKVGKGIEALRTIFRIPKDERDAAVLLMWRNAKGHWTAILRDITLFGIAAVVINVGIGVIAEGRTASSLLIGLGISNADGETMQNAATLFMKNLTVIPLTIVFLCGMIRYLLNVKPVDLVNFGRRKGRITRD
jgi:hypothetical protein